MSEIPAIDSETKNWVKQELKRLEAQEDYSPFVPAVDNLVASWQENNPKMYQRLERAKLTRQFAEVILAGHTGWGSSGQALLQGTWATPAPKEGWEERQFTLPEVIQHDENQARPPDGDEPRLSRKSPAQAGLSVSGREDIPRSSRYSQSQGNISPKGMGIADVDRVVEGFKNEF